MNERQSHPHELISAMLDGEIDERERAVVEAHLRECAECRDLAGDLAALGEVLGDEPVPPVPAGLASRIGWSLRAQGASRRRIAGIRWSGPRMLAALGGVAAAMVLAVLVVREGGAPYRLSRSDLQEPALPARAGSSGAGAPTSDARSAEAKPAENEDDEVEEKLRSLGYAGQDASHGSRTRDGRGATGDAGGRGSGSVMGGIASGPSAPKRDVYAYGTAAPPPKPSESAGGSPAPASPLPPQDMDKRVQKVESDRFSSSTSTGALSPAVPPASPEQAKKAASQSERAIANAEKQQAEGFLEAGGKGGNPATRQDAGASHDAGRAKDANTRETAASPAAGEELRPMPAAPPPPPMASAARAESDALSSSKAKAIDSVSQAKPVIPPCAGAEGATPVKRWAATSVPLPLRAVRSDAEPDLAGLAARLGGSLCADTASGGAPLLVLDVPVARWIDLRDALIARAAAEPSLSAPPAEGFDVVRAVVRPR